MLRMWKKVSLVGFFLMAQSEIGISEPVNASVIEVSRVQAKITPPAGWLADQEVSGLSLVIKEPPSDKPSYDKPKYQRNITLLTMHQPSPIDAQRLEGFKADLAKQMASTGGISGFQVIEAKLFDYRLKNDGILVYSSMKLGEYKMMQMHVLVSGSQKQYLMTYTDLLERFNDSKDYGFAAAWSSMVSLEVEGTGPTRMDQNRNIYLGGLCGFLIFAGLGFWSFARSRTSYRHFADQAVHGKSQDRDAFAVTTRETTVPKKAFFGGGLFKRSSPQSGFGSMDILDSQECSTF